MGNEVGTQGRSLLVPVPRAWDVDGCDEGLLGRSRDMSREERYGKGRPGPEPFEDDLAAMPALPARPLECAGCRGARADEKGRVRVDGRHRYPTSPECAGRETVVGLWATRVAVPGGDGAVVAEHGRACGDVPADTTDPASQPPPANGLGAWREGRARAALPDDLRDHIDALDRRGLGGAVRRMRDRCAPSGWDATVRAASAPLGASGGMGPSAVAPAASRAETGEASCDEAADLAEYDRLAGVVADGWAGEAVARRGARGEREEAPHVGRRREGLPGRRDGRGGPRGRQAPVRRAGEPRRPREGAPHAQGQVPAGQVARGLRLLAGGLPRRPRAGRPRVAPLPGHRRGLRVPRPDREGQDPPRDGDGRAGGLDGAPGAPPLDGAPGDATNADLVILDEFGYVPTDVAGARPLFQVVSDCYERRGLVITTNIEFGRWGTVLGDDRLAAAMIDRVVHHSRLVEFNGTSHRMDQALMLSGNGS